MPVNPMIKPETCFNEMDSFNQKYATTIVINAVDPFKIASILDVAPSEAYENIVNGNALLIIARIIIPGKRDRK